MKNIYLVKIEEDGFLFIDSNNINKKIKVELEIENKRAYTPFYCYLFKHGKLDTEFKEQVSSKLQIKGSKLIVLFKQDITFAEKRCIEEAFMFLRIKQITWLNENSLFKKINNDSESFLTLEKSIRAYTLSYIKLGETYPKFYDIDTFDLKNLSKYINELPTYIKEVNSNEKLNELKVYINSEEDYNSTEKWADNLNYIKIDFDEILKNYLSIKDQF